MSPVLGGRQRRGPRQKVLTPARKGRLGTLPRGRWGAEGAGRGGAGGGAKLASATYTLHTFQAAAQVADVFLQLGHARTKYVQAMKARARQFTITIQLHATRGPNGLWRGSTYLTLAASGTLGRSP